MMASPRGGEHGTEQQWRYYREHSVQDNGRHDRRSVAAKTHERSSEANLDHAEAPRNNWYLAYHSNQRPRRKRFR